MTKSKRGSARIGTLLLIIALLMALSVSAYCAYTFELKPRKLYMKAETLLASGNLAEAAELYKEAGNYKDSAEKCSYATCITEFEAGNIASAADKYSGLSAYTKAMVQEHMGSFEALGMNAISKKDYDSAHAYLTIAELSESSKAALNALDIRAEALMLMENGSYAEARKVLSVLDNKYVNAAEMTDECYKNEYAAFDKLSETDMNAAVDGFESIKDYVPAASWIRDLKQAYRQALDFMEEGNYESAAQLFSGFGDYKLSKLMLTRCKRLMHGEAEAVDWSGEVLEIGNIDNIPIKWVVVESGSNSVTLFSQSPVAVMSYDANGNSVWSKSQLASWLKNEFITCFSSDEKALLSMLTRSYGDNDMDTSVIHAISADEIGLIKAEYYTGYTTVWMSTPGTEAGTARMFDISNCKKTFDRDVTEEHGIMAVITLKY